MLISVFHCNVNIQASLRLELFVTVLTVVLETLNMEVDMLDNVRLIGVLLPTQRALPHRPPLGCDQPRHQTRLVLTKTAV